MDGAWTQAPVWNEWRELTRLQWSGRIAFETELEKWQSPHLADTEKVSIVISDCGANYKTSLENHVKTISDHSLFCSLIFLRSYSLMEGHAKLVKFIVDQQRWRLLEDEMTEEERNQIDAIWLNNAIENWSDELMTQTGQPWSEIYKGKAGLVEMSIIRNAFMHGYSRVSQELLDKAARRASSLPFKADENLRMDFALLHEYRGRLRSFCRILGDGIVHRHRGTHRSFPPS